MLWRPAPSTLSLRSRVDLMRTDETYEKLWTRRILPVHRRYTALAKKFPTPAASAGIVFDQDEGRLSEEAFMRDFAGDLPEAKAKVLYAVQSNRSARGRKRRCSLLAAEAHLDRWLARNHAHGAAISEAALTANIIVDLSGTVRVARWAYVHGASLHAATWLRGDEVEPLSGRWRSLLGIRIEIRNWLFTGGQGSHPHTPFRSPGTRRPRM
jgi:hypothetical protein